MAVDLRINKNNYLISHVVVGAEVEQVTCMKISNSNA